VLAQGRRFGSGVAVVLPGAGGAHPMGKCTFPKVDAPGQSCFWNDVRPLDAIASLMWCRG